MADNNLMKVNIKKGTFYISSKEDKGEGWEKNEFPNPQNKDETLVRYHRTLSIEGRLNYVAIKNDKYQGKVLSLIVGGENESYSLEIPIMSTGSSVKTTNQYFNSVIGALENLKKGDTVTMFVNSKNEDKNGRLYRNIIVLDSNGKLVKSNFTFGELPKWKSEEVEDEFGDKEVKWDASPTNKFYIDLLNKVVDNFGTPQKDEASKPNEQSKSSNSAPPPYQSSKDDEDDLPF